MLSLLSILPKEPKLKSFDQYVEPLDKAIAKLQNGQAKPGAIEEDNPDTKSR